VMLLRGENRNAYIVICLLHVVAQNRDSATCSLAVHSEFKSKLVYVHDMKEFWWAEVELHSFFKLCSVLELSCHIHFPASLVP
jgi:hypothetical protein